ncbi:MAG: ECF-type sigma factor [Planctomycetota bacterium]|nr:ECF-type sigma factor [Planctomycetota bacterium]
MALVPISNPVDDQGVPLNITLMLNQTNGNESEHALRSVWEGLQVEIRSMARSLMARESNAPTLQPTVLVNEAWLRMHKQADDSWENRRHFLGAVSTAMSRFLIDRSRRVQTTKRGSGQRPISIEVSVGEISLFDKVQTPEGLDALEALEALHDEAPEAADVARLRFISGLSTRDTATVLGLTERVVRARWLFAKAWLRRRLAAYEPDWNSGVA